MVLRTLAQRVFTLDLRSLALCRIWAGIVVIGDLLTRAWSFRIHYTDAGILPRQALFELNILRFPSLYAASGWEPFIAGVFLLHGLAAVMLILGYRTRFTGPLVWYLTISLQTRLHMANNGGDTVLASVLFWGMFLPWGEAFSVDAKARQAAARCASTQTEPAPELDVYSAATVILCLQALLMYWISVLAKMEPIWLHGEVLYYAFQCDLYAYPTGQLLLPHTTLMKLLTYGTLAWEIVGPLLLLSTRPALRATACLLFSIMHLSFGMFLRIGIFAFSPLLFAFALLPGLVWDHPRLPFRRVGALFQRLCEKVASKHPPGLRPPIRLSKPVSALLAVLYCHTLLTSLSEDPRIGRILPSSLDWIHQMTGLYQRWGVFVNMPSILDGWFVVEGRLSDGRDVDLFQGTDQVGWDKPPTPFTHYGSFRWPTPLVVITGDNRLHRWLVRALALDWERRHPGQHVTFARLNLMREYTQPDFRDSAAARSILWEGSLER